MPRNNCKTWIFYIKIFNSIHIWSKRFANVQTIPLNRLFWETKLVKNEERKNILISQCQWHHWAGLRGVNNTTELGSVVSITPLSLIPRSLTQRCPWHCRVYWTCEYLHVKPKPYAKRLQQMNKRPYELQSWTKSGVKISWHCPFN